MLCTDCKRETDRWASCALRSSCACVRDGVIRELGSKGERSVQSGMSRRGPEIRGEATEDRDNTAYFCCSIVVYI